MGFLKFPLFIDLTGKKAVVIGGGRIAARRAVTLCAYGAEIIVIAPQISEKIYQLPVAIAERQYISDDLSGAFLAIAATDDHNLNRQITQEARRLGILANNASDRTDCDFFFPAVALTQNLSVGICGTGENHFAVAEAAATIRKMMEETT